MEAPRIGNHPQTVRTMGPHLAKPRILDLNDRRENQGEVWFGTGNKSRETQIGQRTMPWGEARAGGIAGQSKKLITPPPWLGRWPIVGTRTRELQ